MKNKKIIIIGTVIALLVVNAVSVMACYTIITGNRCGGTTGPNCDSCIYTETNPQGPAKTYSGADSGGDSYTTNTVALTKTTSNLQIVQTWGSDEKWHCQGCGAVLSSNPEPAGTCEADSVSGTCP